MVVLLFWTNRPHQLRSWPYSKLSGSLLTSSQVNLLLVRNHQAEVIIIKRLIQERNNLTVFSRRKVKKKLKKRKQK